MDLLEVLKRNNDFFIEIGNTNDKNLVAGIRAAVSAIQESKRIISAQLNNINYEHHLAWTGDKISGVRARALNPEALTGGQEGTLIMYNTALKKKFGTNYHRHLAAEARTI